MKRRLIITIDGPSGAGKSTAAKALAERLGYTYLDSGAMYRAFAYWSCKLGQKEEPIKLDPIVKDFHVRFVQIGSRQRIYIDHEDVSDEVRKPWISMLASELSALFPVRKRMMELQREIGCGGGIVAEGRDMGTVVFPDAHMKFFLTAGLEERAARRFRELLVQQGGTVEFQKVRDDMERRDLQDSSREIAPLKPAYDAVSIDSTHLTADEVVDTMLNVLRNRIYEVNDQEGN